MNWSSWLLWGFFATLLLTTISEVTQGLGLTRMNMPYMLGTLITPYRERAKLYGFFIHLLMGLVFSFFYVLAFESMHAAGWWRGLFFGLIHGIFMLVVIVGLLPGLHPRMASEQHGPEAGNLLEPPGFFALNYGARTPFAVLISHALFGVILGLFYHVK